MEQNFILISLEREISKYLNEATVARARWPVWPDVAVSGHRGRFRGLGGRQNLVVAGGRCGRLLRGTK